MMMVILGDDDGIGNYKCKVFLRRCYTKQLCFRKEKQFQDCMQRMLQLHQAICSMQLAMIIIKNSMKTASANVWHHNNSLKPI
jgi:hypothetical protein